METCEHKCKNLATFFGKNKNEDMDMFICSKSELCMYTTIGEPFHVFVLKDGIIGAISKRDWTSPAQSITKDTSQSKSMTLQLLYQLNRSQGMLNDLPSYW